MPKTADTPLTDCCECRVHRVDYYAALASGAEPTTARRAFKAKIALGLDARSA